VSVCIRRCDGVKERVEVKVKVKWRYQANDDGGVANVSRRLNI